VNAKVMADWQMLPIMAIGLTTRNKPNKLKLKQFGRRTDANYVREVNYVYITLPLHAQTTRVDYNLGYFGRLKRSISLD